MELSTRYRVSYSLPGDSIPYRAITVEIWEGYSTTDDIPKILAVWHWGDNSLTDEVTVHSFEPMEH